MDEITKGVSFSTLENRSSSELSSVSKTFGREAKLLLRRSGPVVLHAVSHQSPSVTGAG